MGLKDLSLKNILSQKIFGPPPLPYGIGLSKVDWIGRGGVGIRGDQIIPGKQNFPGKESGSINESGTRDHNSNTGN